MEAIQEYRQDEFEVDFEDTKSFVSKRWNEEIPAVLLFLTRADSEKVMDKPRNWQTLHTEIRTRAADLHTGPATRRLLNNMQPLPRSLLNLLQIFAAAISPLTADFKVLWGLMDLNIKLSCTTTERSVRTSGWTKRLRTSIELLNRCLEHCEDMNEARLKMVEVLEYTLQIFGESIRHFRQCSTETEALRGWKATETKITDSLSEIDWAIRHLHDITTYSKVDFERQVKDLSIRHGPANQPEENVSFPLLMIERPQNNLFYGREEELAKMNAFLDNRSEGTLRTYTIYGKRGVGKTGIALQYAYTNPAGFDAIFWVQCETALVLRQSFTNMAVDLALPNADRNGHHEENQIAVLKWLKLTKRRWLLIFDNAEKEYVLKGYWPVAARGSILITSRKYYNFMNDAKRQGATVRPFNPAQSWSLLLRLLGPDWEEREKNGQIRGHEKQDGKDFLESLGGLALAIEQAAELIRNPEIGDQTISATYERYTKDKERLTDRPGRPRSEGVRSLDTLWNMTFGQLSRNARELLKVLALLSPDPILIDLFLPKKQSALNGNLDWCKHDQQDVDEQAVTALASVVTISQALSAAIKELVKFRLINNEGRAIWAHRVVQEAVNYQEQQDLQDSFNAAARLVYEAFPKSLHGDYFSQQAPAAQAYISHATHLSRQFATYRASGDSILVGTRRFIDLLYNASWYLYEVGDYEMCLRVVDTARAACTVKDSLQMANLLSCAGCAYYEQNKLAKCREAFEECMRLQELLLPDNELERSMSYHNMGNLEYASDNMIDAKGYYTRAIDIRNRSGDAAVNLLAISYLCQSRVYFHQKDHETAFKTLEKAEALFVRTSGAGAPLMAHVHYAYGNMEFAQKNWWQANRSYDSALKIALATAAVHPITISIYYSLGCVEFERQNLDHARHLLDKAMTIAQLRSPNRDDGMLARILWKLSKVLEADTYGTYEQEGDDLRRRAEVARAKLNYSGEASQLGSEGDGVVSLDEEWNVYAMDEEDTYDALIPAYFR